MCEPVSIASLAISAGSAVYGHRQKSKAAATEAAQTREGMALSLGDLSERLAQSEQDTAEAMSERSLQGMREMSLIDTMVGERGGDSRLATEASAVAGRDIATLEANQKRVRAEGRRDALAILKGGQSRLASIQRPSAVGTGLLIGSSLADAYGSYKNANAPKRTG